MLVDTHAHIYESIYPNIAEVVKNAKSKGIKKVINCAEDIKSSEEVVFLSSKFENFLFCSVGIHPHNAEKYDFNDIKKLKDLSKSKGVVAIGEIGLDFFYGKSYSEKQIELFNLQLKLANELKLPVIVHSRNSTNETIDILKKYNLNGIIHCFSGTLKEANKFIKLGYLLGIGGILTFKNSNLREVIKNIPLEYIVLETDSPFLTPEPYRKYKNEPKYILEIVNLLAKIYQKTPEEIILKTYENIVRFFDFS